MVITNIEKFRRAFPMSKTVLAKRIGVSCMAVSLWESGKAKPGTEATMKLAEIFSCDLQEVLGVEDLSAFNRNSGSTQQSADIEDTQIDGWED